MKPVFGVCLPNFGKHVSAETVARVAEEAEEMGYDSVWATDHLILPPSHRYPYGNILEALTTMAYVSSVTEQVKIGSSVIILPMREPVQVAKALASIDFLSGGRVIAGFGAGWSAEEFQNIGMNFNNRGRRFDEALKLVRTLWRGGEVSFKGRYYSVESGVFEPRPVQPGGPPVWVGGNSEKAFNRAVALADGWHFTGIPLETLAQRLHRFQPKNGFTISGRLTIDFTGKSPRLTKSRLGEDRVILSGNFDYVSDVLEDYLEQGVTYFALYFGDKPADQYVKDMEAFLREVAASYV
ncbi:MAG: TIGR03619 family F420-dependent LLM class oxidoreductase [Candidatus Caldarchaeum sp.]